jgi:hypothetical protein
MSRPSVGRETERHAYRVQDCAARTVHSAEPSPGIAMWQNSAGRTKTRYWIGMIGYSASFSRLSWKGVLDPGLGGLEHRGGTKPGLIGPELYSTCSKDPSSLRLDETSVQKLSLSLPFAYSYPRLVNDVHCERGDAAPHTSPSSHASSLNMSLPRGLTAPLRQERGLVAFRLIALVT